MKSAFGAFAATILSVGARGLGHVIYGLLLIVYRRDVKLMLLYAGVIAAIVLLMMWIF